MFWVPFFWLIKNIFLPHIPTVLMKKVNLNNKYLKPLGNKWVFATLVFLVWIIFFDENSIISHQQNKQRLYELKQQEKYYRKMIVSDREKLEDLKEGEQKLEKFAREQYYMAKPGEDVFIVVEDD